MKTIVFIVIILNSLFICNKTLANNYLYKNESSQGHDNQAVWLFGFIDSFSPPYINSDSGKAIGVDFDIINTIAHELGYKLNYVPYNNTNELVEALESGRVDFALQDPRNLKGNFHLSELIYRDRIAVIEKNHLQGESRYACLKGQFYCKDIDNVITVIDHYDNIKLLEDNFVTGIVSTYATLVHHTLDSNTYGNIDFLQQELFKEGYLITSEKNLPHLNDINKIIRNYNKKNLKWTENKSFLFTEFSGKVEEKFELRKPLRYTIENDVYPAIYLDSTTNTPRGYVVDILRYIEQRTSLSFKYIPNPLGKSDAKLMEDGEIDFSPYQYTEKSKLFFNDSLVTNPYYHTNYVIVDVKKTTSKKVGILARSIISQNHLSDILPEAEDTILFSNLDDLIIAISSGSISKVYLSKDVFTQDFIITASDNLNISSSTELQKFPISMVFSNEIADTFHLVDAFLSTISITKINELKNNYGSSNFFFGFDEKITYTSILLSAILSLGIWWLYKKNSSRLRKDLVIERKKKELTDQTLQWFRSLLEDLPVGLLLTNGKNNSLISNRLYRDRYINLKINHNDLKDDNGIIEDDKNELAFQYYRIPFNHPISKEPGYLMVWNEISELEKQKKELINARNIAERSLEIRQQFTAMITHELRTPISGILGLIGLLKERHNDCKDSLELLESLHNSAVNLNQHVNEILDISKSESGQLTLDFEDCNLLKELDNLFQQYETVCKENDLSFSIYWQPTKWIFGHTDRNRVIQVISNLLSNAVKFTDSGGINVSVSITYNQFEISIADTGIGISQGDIETLYQPYTQADSSISRKYGGTGLGMTIVKNFVDMLDGEISIKSELDKGTCVKIKLPMTTFPPSELFDYKMFTNVQEINNWLKCFNALDETLPITTFPEHKVKSILRYPSEFFCLLNKNSKQYPMPSEKKLLDGCVLIVDDNPINRLLLEKQIELFGLTVQLASNGIEALKYINKSNDLDLVLTDCRMPKLSGYELTKRIREIKQDIELPIIGCTAEVSDEAKELAFNSGMNDIIFKPYELQDLYKVISQYLKPKVNIIPSHAGEFIKGFIPIKHKDILPIIVNTYKEDIDHLRIDEKNIKNIIHRIKGSASLLGMPVFSTYLSNLESKNKIDQHDTELVVSILSEIISMCEKYYNCEV
ncbi:ATP-binding protein [Photobacterium sp. DA100]|uniref:ATP-binding protein n=1 Tax=Photobacterium sp. DA100 TaxID=3027472 RepID=UPI00247A761D|nr:ATP-binding protein [Photobacterium sp. DA100]WEM43697.1 ATP-binding protein [Photobacterium sp. DA100]